jgi:hypothetical protein
VIGIAAHFHCVLLSAMMQKNVSARQPIGSQKHENAGKCAAEKHGRRRAVDIKNRRAPHAAERIPSVQREDMQHALGAYLKLGRQPPDASGFG